MFWHGRLQFMCATASDSQVWWQKWSSKGTRHCQVNSQARANAESCFVPCGKLCATDMVTASSLMLFILQGSIPIAKQCLVWLSVGSGEQEALSARASLDSTLYTGQVPHWKDSHEWEQHLFSVERCCNLGVRDKTGQNLKCCLGASNAITPSTAASACTCFPQIRQAGGNLEPLAWWNHKVWFVWSGNVGRTGLQGSFSSSSNNNHHRLQHITKWPASTFHEDSERFSSLSSFKLLSMIQRIQTLMFRGLPESVTMHVTAASPSVLAALRKQQPSEAGGKVVQGVMERVNGDQGNTSNVHGVYWCLL